MAAKSLQGGVTIASTSLQEGVNIVDEDEKAVQALPILGKHQEMMVLELPRGHAEPGHTPDRRVQSALMAQQAQVISLAGRLHL